MRAWRTSYGPRASPGSFTNHFASKEEFGLQVLERYFAKAKELIAATLRNDDMAPRQRLRAYIDANIAFMEQHDMRNGCLLGNFSADVGHDGETIRVRLADVLGDVQKSVACCLKAAVKAGALPKGYRTGDIAGFIVSSLQGAFLIAKAQRDIEPIERFRQVLFSTILK